MIHFFKKIKKFVIFLVVFLFVIFLVSQRPNYSKDEIEYGLTFSKKQAQTLGLDWKKIFIAMFDDLDIKKLRIPAYWDEIENSKGEFWWADLDWQLEEAKKRDVEVILSVGSRLPRWPECHFPDWAEGLPVEEREKETLEYINKVVNRYKDYKNIIAWQVENEPFLSHFGECPELNSKFLDLEISIVKDLDDRPIVVTDSGELSLWVFAAKRADIFGTTMYRDTYSNALKKYIHYPITPGFFKFKRNIVSLFAKPKKWIVIELQAEPWGHLAYQKLSREDKDKTMSLQKFKDMIEFSSKTGFKEFYLWGVEWWYFEAEKQNNTDFLEFAKEVFKK